MKAKEKYAQAQQKVKKALEEAKAVARQAFDEGSKELFEAHPELQSFRWAQFTPYFNDGDACHFGVRSPQINGEEWVSRKGPLRPVHDAVAEFLNSFADGDMLRMFGDHVEITVSRGGETEVSDYYHD